MRSGKAVPDGRSSSWEVSGTNSGKIAGKDSEEPGTLQGKERRGGREKYKVREAVWLNCMENYRSQAADTLSLNLVQLIYVSAELCKVVTER